MTYTEKRLELLEQLVKEVTDYGFNDEYGYYDDWAYGVKPILEKAIAQAVAEERERMREKIEKSIEYINWSHSVGSHSDDRGGDSDIECTCREDEVRYKTEAYKNVLSSLDKPLTDKEK